MTLYTSLMIKMCSMHYNISLISIMVRNGKTSHCQRKQLTATILDHILGHIL